MPTNDSEDEELRSWKEIAEYLGVSIRTAQLWEAERDLPVTRLPGARSRVSATKGELDAWKRSSPEPNGGRRGRRWIAVAGAAAVAFAAVAAHLLTLQASTRPASFRLEGNFLIVQDAAGSEVWRKVFPEPLRGGGQAWFGDLDDDGRTEMLYALRVRIGSTAPLICYSGEGEEKWRFAPGRAVATPEQDYAPIYYISRFKVFEVSPGRRAIAVTSHHYLHHPNQVALLSAEGKLLREYWHSGHLYSLEMADFDGDKSPDIYLGGISNGYRAATLVVLDPRNFHGASAEAASPNHQLRGFTRGNERARLVFPRTCINRKFEPYNCVRDVVVEPERIVVKVCEKDSPALLSVVYRFTRDLRPETADPGDRLCAFHRELEEEGRLDHAFGATERADLLAVEDLARPHLSARRSSKASAAEGRPSSKPGR